MPADDFFNKPMQPDVGADTANSEQTEAAPPESPKVKIGEKEYTTDELSDYVSFGTKVRDFEKKSGTDFDSLTKSWGTRGERIGKMEKELEAYRNKELQAKQQAGEPLSEEEQIRQAREQAKKLGLVTRDDFDEYYSSRRQAEKLLDDCKDLEGELDGKDGRPAFKTQDILTHMQHTGIRNPEKAYKDKYEAEIDKWKEAQLGNAKPKGLYTDERSTAGIKAPPNVKITKDNLYNVIKETLNRE